MRHSAYNDYAAQTLLLFMAERGFGMQWFAQHQVSPIILREETVFLKEIAGNETISIDVRLLRMSKDGSRWSF
ncbi:MAG: thioesterase family protein, partial [Bacteroidota bacterium]